jgi:hypothetical protein
MEEARSAALAAEAPWGLTSEIAHYIRGWWDARKGPRCRASPGDVRLLGTSVGVASGCWPIPAVGSAYWPVLYLSTTPRIMAQCGIIRRLGQRLVGTTRTIHPTLGVSRCALLPHESRTPRGLPMLVSHGDFCHTTRVGHSDFNAIAGASTATAFLQDVLTVCKSDAAMQEDYNQDS